MLEALAGVAALVIGVITYTALRRGNVGQGRFFADQSYHFQTLRVMNDVPSDGAATAEVLETIKHVRSGDAQGWFQAWSDTGDRVTRSAASTTDRIAKRHALLRAHNYYRTAEFFLLPDDTKWPVSAAKNIHSFYAGLDALGVAYQQIKVPYGEGHHLEAVYYPVTEGGLRRPLIILGGGFDFTLEELYFVLVKDAHEHGYAVLTYDGPGQGSVLRDQGLTFTHEWEKPTTAVVDAFLADHSRPHKMVLVGMSMGGYLAPRAAAFDERFDGVVTYDVFFDAGAIARRYVPAAAFWLRDHGFGALVDKAPDAKLFPAWSKDEELRSDIRLQPALFFYEMLKRNLSVLSLIDSTQTVATRKLAKHMGETITFTGDAQQPQWVDLPKGSIRGGLLGMPAVLAVSSYPYRTSPVLRGAWILESILGTPPPPPPAEVPALEKQASAEAPKSVREMLTQHRANPACATCHSRIDPLGFALENYDFIGRWRDQDAGKPIDNRGELPDGTAVAGPQGLKLALLDRKDLFVRNLTAKMLGYALGRGLTPQDSCTVDRIVAELKENDYRAQKLVELVILSAPFQYQPPAPARPKGAKQ